MFDEYLFDSLSALQGGVKDICMFEFPSLLLPSNLEQLMHSPSALTELTSPNLAGINFGSTLFKEFFDNI